LFPGEHIGRSVLRQQAIFSDLIRHPVDRLSQKGLAPRAAKSGFQLPLSFYQIQFHFLAWLNEPSISR
jgi:hypothetical protein